MPAPLQLPDFRTSGRPTDAWFPQSYDYGTDADSVDPSELPDGWTKEGAALISGPSPNVLDNVTGNMHLSALRNQAAEQLQGNRIMQGLGGLDLTKPEGLTGYERLIGDNPLGVSTPYLRNYLSTIQHARALSQQQRNAPLDEMATNLLAKAYSTDWTNPDEVSALRDELKSNPGAFRDPRVARIGEQLITHQQAMAGRTGRPAPPIKPLSVNEEGMLSKRIQDAVDQDVPLDLKQGYLKSKGINPEIATPEQWDQAYQARYWDTPQRKATRNFVSSLVRSGREISPFYLDQLGLDETGQPIGNHPVPAQKNVAAGTPTPEPVPTTGLTQQELYARQAVSRRAEEAKAKFAEQAPLREAWTAAKTGLKSRLEEAFKNNPQELDSLYQTIAKGERLAQPGTGIPMEGDPVRQLLMMAGIKPDETTPIEGKTQEDVARELARELANKTRSVSYLSPQGTKITVGPPKKAS